MLVFSVDSITESAYLWDYLNECIGREIVFGMKLLLGLLLSKDRLINGNRVDSN